MVELTSLAPKHKRKYVLACDPCNLYPSQHSNCQVSYLCIFKKLRWTSAVQTESCTVIARITQKFSR